MGEGEVGRMVGRRGGGGRGKRSLGSTGVKSRYQTQPTLPTRPPPLPPSPFHPDDPANPLPRPHPPPSPRPIQTSAHFHLCLLLPPGGGRGHPFGGAFMHALRMCVRVLCFDARHLSLASYSMFVWKYRWLGASRLMLAA